MDGQELRTQMMQSLVLGMKNIAEERKTTNSGPYYAELTGRLDAMRTILDYLMNTPPPAEEQQGPKKGCEECGGECQGHPDSGGKEEGEE